MVKNFSSAGGGPLSSSTHPRGGGERGGGGGPVISVFEGINRWISEDFSISNTNNNTQQQQREKYLRTTNDSQRAPSSIHAPTESVRRGARVRARWSVRGAQSLQTGLDNTWVRERRRRREKVEIEIGCL